MDRHAAVAGEAAKSCGVAGGLWALTMPVLLFALGAAVFGVGCWQLFRTAERWEAFSNLLLGAALALLGVSTRRQALGTRLSLTPRLVVVGLMLAAVAIHFLLV